MAFSAYMINLKVACSGFFSSKKRREEKACLRFFSFIHFSLLSSPFCEMVLNGIAVHVAIFLRLSCRVLLKNKLPPAEMKYNDAVSISDLLDVLDH